MSPGTSPAPLALPAVFPSWRLGWGWTGPPGSHSTSPSPHGCSASPPTLQRGTDINSFSTPKPREAHTNVSIPHPQALLYFPAGTSCDGGVGVRSGDTARAAASSTKVGRRLEGPAIEERNVFARAGNCWARRARDPPAKKTSGGRKAAGAQGPQGGRKGAPGAGMPAMSLLRAGVPDPLLALLLARTKPAAQPHFLRTGRPGAEQQPQRCRQLLFKPCLSFPNLKITLRISHTWWRAPSWGCRGRHELSAGLRAAGLCCAEPWTSTQSHDQGSFWSPVSMVMEKTAPASPPVTLPCLLCCTSGAMGVMGCRAEPTGMGMGQTRSRGRSQRWS